MKKFWRWLFALILLAILGLGGRHFFFKPRRRLTIIYPQRRDLTKELHLAGHIEAEEKVDLRFKTGGKLAWVGVKEGNWVHKYQPLASLDKYQLERDFRKALAAYLKVRNHFEQENADYGYWQHWFELNDRVKRLLANDQYDLNRAVADVELAKMALDEATLITPIAGLVTQVSQPYAGVNITPTEAVFRVVNPDSVYFWAEVDEDGVTWLKPGMAATVSLDAYPGKTFAARLTAVSFNSLGSGSNPSYRVKMRFLVDNHDLKFRLGMDGEAVVKVATVKNALVVPALAVENGPPPVVYLWRQHRRYRQPVKIGLSTDEWVEIKQGLKDHQALVLP